MAQRQTTMFTDSPPATSGQSGLPRSTFNGKQTASQAAQVARSAGQGSGEKESMPLPSSLRELPNYNSETLMAIWSFVLAFGLPIAYKLGVGPLMPNSYVLWYWGIQFIAAVTVVCTPMFDRRDVGMFAIMAIAAFFFRYFSYL